MINVEEAWGGGHACSFSTQSHCVTWTILLLKIYTAQAPFSDLRHSILPSIPEEQWDNDLHIFHIFM
jgi:hypothetical protein